MSTEYTRIAMREREDVIVLLLEIIGAFMVKMEEKGDMDLVSMFLFADTVRIMELASEKFPELRERLANQT